MFEKVVVIILIAGIVFIPVVMWGYIFSYLNDTLFSRRRFISGILWGAIAVIPIVFLEKILESPSFSVLNIFEKITQVDTGMWIVSFNISLGFFIFTMAGVAFIFSSWIQRSKKLLAIYSKNIIYFCVFVIIMSFIIFIVTQLDIGNSIIDNSTNFGNTLFNTTKLLIFYYFLVALIEESSKYFNFLQSSVLNIATPQNAVLYAIFVALWFAFIENILYLYNLYMWGKETMELLSTFFYRSIFSIMTHILCSVVVAYSFTKIFLTHHWNGLHIKYIKTLLIGIFAAVMLHLIFDISLSFWFGFIVILYFVWGYFYISSIFYKK